MKATCKEQLVIITAVFMFLVPSCTHTKKDLTEISKSSQEETEMAELDERDVYEPPVKVVSNLSNIYFDFDSAILKPASKDELKKIASWLSEKPSVKIRIEGNCDERGTNEYNIALGERRAVSAKHYLVSLGISPTNIMTISFGEEKPADPEHSEAAWAKNRRDEFNIVE